MKKDVSDKRQIFSQIRNSVIDTALQRLARNSGWLLAAEAVAAIVSVLQFPLVARLLGAEGYGKATLIVGWVGLLGSLLGIQTRKTMGRYFVQKKWNCCCDLVRRCRDPRITRKEHDFFPPSF